MNFYRLKLDFEDSFFFLDLNYMTQEGGATWHWFLCLNTGTKQQVTAKHLRLLEPVEYSDIPQTMETL